MKKDVKQIEEKVSTSVIEALDNNKEKEEKEKNAIMFNVPEVKFELGKSQKEYDDEDHTQVNFVMKETLGDKFKPILDKTKITRLGKRNDNNPRPRPVKVELQSAEEKWTLLRNAGNLKNARVEEIQNVSIRRDKTKMELQEDRRLKAKCDKMRNDTGKNYIIFAEHIMLKEDVNAFKEERKRKQEEERRAREQEGASATSPQ